MAQLHLQSSWEEVKDRIKEHNTNLTDGDLQYGPGHEDELLHRLANKLGKSKKEIKAWIESLSANIDKAG
jgi:hypothetical protein